MIEIITFEGLTYFVKLLPDGSPDFVTYSHTLSMQRDLQEAYEAGRWKAVPAEHPLQALQKSP